MKFFTLATALPALALAGKRSKKSDDDGPTQSGIEHFMEDIADIEDSLPESLINEMPKSFGSDWSAEIIDSINEYGCWCYFQNDHGKGRGSPVNEVDAQCKILQDGYACILMDAEDEGEDSCTPWDVKYNSASGLGMLASDTDNNDNLEDSLRYKCKRANRKSNCAARTCMVENYFVIRLVRLFLHGVPFDPSVKHSLGIFNPENDCPTKAGEKSDKECCGEYPLRFPFKHLNGDRACCGARTYNTELMMCCGDNSIRISC